MSLFGKILLVVNLLAAVGFISLASKDWRGRQDINAVGLQYFLLLTGLPLDGPTNFSSDDETPFVVDGPGGVPTKTIGKKLLDKYFSAGSGADARPNSLGPGGAVPNQLVEVRRVKTKIEELLGKAGSDAERIQLLGGWLLYQAETFAIRTDILTLTAPNREDVENGVVRLRPKTEDELKQDAEELQRRLMARFDAVLESPKAADAAATTALADADLPAPRTDDEKTRAILKDKLDKIVASRVAPLDSDERRIKTAHLLVHLDTDAAWQKRVMLVVGLRRYVTAVEIQANRFREMSKHLEQLLHPDQTSFLEQIASLETRATDATRIATRQSAIKAKWEEQFNKDTDLVKERETQLTGLRNQLIKIKNEVDAMLARQATIEIGLFEVQREVAITLDEVYKLEADLRARERQLLGAPPEKK